MPHGKTYAVLAAEGIVIRAKQVFIALLEIFVRGEEAYGVSRY
jgi:hypothetical protein